MKSKMTVTLGSYCQLHLSINCQRLATCSFTFFFSVLYLCSVSPNFHLPIFLPLSLIVQRRFTFFASCRVIKSDHCRHVGEEWSGFPFFSKLSRKSRFKISKLFFWYSSRRKNAAPQQYISTRSQGHRKSSVIPSTSVLFSVQKGPLKSPSVTCVCSSRIEDHSCVAPDTCISH